MACLTVGVAIGLLCLSPRARAEPAFSMALTPTYSYLVLEGRGQPAGGGAALSLRLGLSEAVLVGVTAHWTAHEVEATEKLPGGLLQIVGGYFEVVYRVDLHPLTPLIEVGAGVLYRRLAGEGSADIALKAGLALEYWVSHVAIGIAIHYHGLLSSLTQFPAYVDIGPRLALRF